MTDENNKADPLGPARKSLAELAKNAEAMGHSPIPKPMGASEANSDQPSQIEIIRKMLADQQTLIHGIGPRLPSIKMPDLIPPNNPGFETNERLETVTSQLDDLKQVIVDGASIANAIQGHAAEFLEKFKEASEATDRSARRGIRIAIVAALIAVITPFLQPAIDLSREALWPDTEMPAIKSGIAKLQDIEVQRAASTDVRMKEQTQVLRSINDALAEIAAKPAASNETIEVLKDIRELVARNAAGIGRPH